MWMRFSGYSMKSSREHSGFWQYPPDAANSIRCVCASGEAAPLAQVTYFHPMLMYSNNPLFSLSGAHRAAALRSLRRRSVHQHDLSRWIAAKRTVFNIRLPSRLCLTSARIRMSASDGRIADRPARRAAQADSAQRRGDRSGAPGLSGEPAVPTGVRRQPRGSSQSPDRHTH